MKKRILGIVIMCVAAAAVLTLAVSAARSSTTDVNEFATVVMSVNGTDITEKEFETFKATTNNAQTSYTDEQLLNILAKQQVLFDEAKRRGLTATSAEIDYAIDVAKDALQQPYQSEARSFLNSYIEQLGITEDQYWESMRSEYEKSLSIGKLQNQLRMELVTADDTDAISVADWDTYYNSFTNQLLSSASVQIEADKLS